jgi:hypothetical protein
MNYAWQGTLEEASAYSLRGEITPRVEEGFQKAYGQTPNPQEVEAWRGSLPGTIAALSYSLNPGVQIVLEYRLPFNGQRADLVLVGRKGGDPVAHVVELKHWEESRVHPVLDHFVLTRGAPASHPSYQAANYAGKLRYFHSVVQNWEVGASAFVLDRSADLHSGLKDAKYVDLWTTAPVFLPGEDSFFAEHVARQIQGAPQSSDVSDFLNGTYSQSIRLLDGISAHQQEIEKRAISALAVAGWGLSDDQLHVYDNIMSAAINRNPLIFLLSGGPGSGKTLLAIHLLLGLASSGRKVILAVRNNRLNAALRKVIDFRPFGASGTVKFFSAPQRTGVEDGSDKIADVLVCDEAQRLALETDNVFRRAPITVILYDEGQILNIEEAGTTRGLMDSSKRIGVPVSQLHLPTLHRCRGGQAYVRWVDTLLGSPGAISSAPEYWKNEYALDVVSSPRALPERLRAMQESGKKVALLAAFTRSSGSDKPRNPDDLGRVRVPELNPSVIWLMDPRKDYVPFWVDCRSNDLTHCSSIYGCQGFETDYAGLVWGDDLVIRDGRWQVGNPDNCYDTAPGATKLSRVMRTDPATAMRLLQNRYRILLTRGIFGTFVYCEDPETGEFLRSLVAGAGGT